MILANIIYWTLAIGASAFWYNRMSLEDFIVSVVFMVALNFIQAVKTTAGFYKHMMEFQIMVGQMKEAASREIEELKAKLQANS